MMAPRVAAVARAHAAAGGYRPYHPWCRGTPRATAGPAVVPPWDGAGRRGVATTPGHGHDEVGDATRDSTRLLTRATAKQMKGDIPEAIALTSRAVSLLRGAASATANSEEEVAEALVFLGKLQMQPNAQGHTGRSETNMLEDAARSFEEARQIFHSIYGAADRRKECTALCHLASAQAQIMSMVEQAEANYQAALKGLADTAGWRDGMTNHTAFQLAKLYKKRGSYKQAVATLTHMKNELALVFGAADSKVLQLNGELAELWQLIGKEGDSADLQDNMENAGGDDDTEAPKSPDETAAALLEEALDSLPSNSPEYMGIFMRLEDLKDQIEAATEAGGRSTSQNVSGVIVTRTTAPEAGR